MDRRKFIKTLGKAGLAVVASAIPGCENNYDNLEFIITDHSPAVKKPVIEKTEKSKESEKKPKEVKIYPVNYIGFLLPGHGR